MRKAPLPIHFTPFLLFFFLASPQGMTQTVTLNFTNMTPHVGQKLEARLVDKSTLKEADRAQVDPIAAADFSIELTGETGKSYFVDFYADLNQNGVYDPPSADHAWRLEADELAEGANTLDFSHNTDFTDIQWKQLLTFDFTGMTPHVGQKLEVAVRDLNQTGKEVGRVSLDAIAAADFSLDLPFLEVGHSYAVDFYADLNQNGIYDAPPADHAWRELLLDVDGDESLSFAHNTSFTDIQWKQLLTFDFTGMTPHVGQKLEIRVREKNRAGREVGRFSLPAIISPNFTVELPFLEIGKSYMVDFYADLNKNGIYDAPPADHAWREMVDDVAGNESLAFSHNTSFTDIQWRHLMRLNFANMTPHLTQRLEVRVRDVNQTGREVGRFTMPAIPVPNFTVSLPYLEPGRTYMFDFYADHNKNGLYDAPPADHAWREMVSEVQGDEDLTFTHNTNFTDIGETNVLTVDFTNMNPHVGQMLELRIIETETGSEVERFKGTIAAPNFLVELPGIQSGKEYQVDFYADLNQNGLYDAPPVDHAWRETLSAGDGNQTVKFNHNTNFTDIDWVYQMTLAATDMTPHLGQLFELRVINTTTDAEIGSFSMPSIQVPFFFVRVPGLRVGENYNADFYADFNQNGTYDAPPADHAWRVNFDDDEGDEIVEFQHNTDFTDIMFPTTAVEAISELKQLQVFPNPFINAINLSLDLDASTDLTITLFNSLGQPMKMLWRGPVPAGGSNLYFEDMQDFAKGVYYLRLQNGKGQVNTVPLIR